MCGRFTLRATAKQIAEQFGISTVPDFPPRFNIAPSQPILAVRTRFPFDSPLERECLFMQWGLVPHWVKELKGAPAFINARSETVEEKPAFRVPFRYRRCLVPADGFYEWRKLPRGKQPYFICLKGDTLFAFAGLWNHWEAPDGSALDSCVILTTDANQVMRPIHDRMPVILSPEHYASWLDPQITDFSQLRSLLQPYPEERMEAVPITSRVNNPKFDDPRCLEPAV